MSSQARGLQNFVSDLRNAKGKVRMALSIAFVNLVTRSVMAVDDVTYVTVTDAKTPKKNDTPVTFLLMKSFNHMVDYVLHEINTENYTDFDYWGHQWSSQISFDGKRKSSPRCLS